jgi:hypothetical protein
MSVYNPTAHQTEEGMDESSAQWAENIPEDIPENEISIDDIPF